MKTILVVVLVFSMVMGTGLQAAAIPKRDYVEISSLDEVVPQATPLWLEVLLWAFKTVLINGMPGPASWEPEVTHHDYGVEISTGSIKFNDGSDGFGAVIKDVYGEGSGYWIMMYGHSHQLFWVGNISLLLRDPNGQYPVNKTIGHRQYIWHFLESIGYYEVIFSSTDKHSWTLFIDYTQYGLNNSIENLSTDNKTVNIDGRRYLLPSNQHANTSSSELRGNSENNTITMAELYDQFYDTEKQLLVDVAKDFIAGDRIYINDCIFDLHYNDEKDITEFIFSNKDEFTEIHFSGDLTRQFKAGDNVTLVFKLLPICEEHNLVILNYNKLIIEQDNAPDINQFLIY